MGSRQQTVETVLALTITDGASTIFENNPHARYPDFLRVVALFAVLQAIIVAIGENLTDDVSAIREYAANDLDLGRRDIGLAEQRAACTRQHTFCAYPVARHNTIDAIALHRTWSNANTIRDRDHLVLVHDA